MFLLVDQEHRDGAFNMSLDALLAEMVAAGAMPAVLRLYGWRPPAVSVGRNQRLEGLDLEACRREGVDVVRRPTGGRAVFHRDELTYSVAARTDDPALGGAATDSYRAIAQGLCRGLQLLGVPAELVRTSTLASAGSAQRLGTSASTLLSANPQTPEETTGRSPSCFAASGRYELTVRGRKILGSAQRRTGGTFLQQGSLLLRQGQDTRYFAGSAGQQATTVEQELGRPVTFAEAAAAMEQGCREGWGLTFESLALDSEQLRSAEERASQHLIASSAAGRAKFSVDIMA